MKTFPQSVIIISAEKELEMLLMQIPLRCFYLTQDKRHNHVE